MASMQYGESPQARPTAFGRVLAWLAVLIVVATLGLVVLRTEAVLSPQILIAVIGALALGLVLIAVSLMAVLIESRELADIKARFDRADQAHQDAMRHFEEGLAELDAHPLAGPKG